MGRTLNIPLPLFHSYREVSNKKIRHILPPHVKKPSIYRDITDMESSPFKSIFGSVSYTQRHSFSSKCFGLMRSILLKCHEVTTAWRKTHLRGVRNNSDPTRPRVRFVRPSALVLKN